MVDGGGSGAWRWRCSAEMRDGKWGSSHGRESAAEREDLGIGLGAGERRWLSGEEERH